MQKSTVSKAAWASFAVYLLPVVGPHFVALWALVLWREVTHAEREMPWLLADLTLALALQVAAGFVFDVFFRWKVTMPGCQLRDVEFEAGEAGGGLQWLSSSGAALFTRWNRETDEQTFWHLPTDGGARRLEPPADLKHWSPVLSSDGNALAWTVRKRKPDGSLQSMVVLREVTGGGERQIRLPKLAGSPEVVAFDTGFSRLTVSTSAGEVLAVNLDGELVWGPHRLGDVRHVFHNFRRHGDGWVAWDAYRERGRYRVEWSLQPGEGVYAIPKGRSITSVAVDPWGRYIGVSVIPAYNIGNVSDAVFVFRADDGQEVYRRYLSPYSRSEVAFVGAHFFAFSLFEEGVSVVEVLRVPGPSPVSRSRAWAEAYRVAFEPLLSLFDRLDAEGLGQEECEMLPATISAAAGLAAAPDDVTAESLDALIRRMNEAAPACQAWDPMAFAGVVSDAEYLMQHIEETLVYEHGLRAIPDLGPIRAGSSFIRPVTDAGGLQRAKRFRADR